MTNYVYPTAATTTVFLNGLHVEHAYRLDWKEDDQRVPIYGYNDRHFSKVAEGRVIIQGFLVTNFVYAGYLKDVLSRNPHDLVGLEAFRRGNFGFSDRWRYSDELIHSYQQELREELASFTDDTGGKEAKLEYIKSLFESRNKQHENEFNVLKESLKRTHSITEQRVSRRNDLRSESSVLNEQPGGTSLDVYYQDPDKINWRMAFSNVYFNSVSQQISIAGAEGSSEPLYEVYEFIASHRKVVKTGNETI